MSEPEGRFDRWRRAAESAGASAGEARTRLIKELAVGLAALVGRAKLPLLAVGVAPLPFALVLVLEGLALGGTAGQVVVVLGLIGAVPGLWVLWRRRRLVGAVQPVEELAAELAQAYDIAGAWAKAGDALQRVRTAGPGLRGAGRAARGIWAGVRLTRELFDRFSDLPRVAPFVPVRLQFTGYLCVASLASVIILAALCVVGVLALAADAVI
ncbi:hypothetical protein [Jiangella asiatica]|uniref:Uncharacterized protein n=1 Tax=Jiangella asiatica TaxID=2530372 RepID=A0A4R5DGA9_9ACTN|nr:hypothetical protein [Jiangella asiatica]TDE12237.1 hypothetical protein E1269_08125 [Jiangella asiatica]